MRKAVFGRIPPTTSTLGVTGRPYFAFQSFVAIPRSARICGVRLARSARRPVSVPVKLTVEKETVRLMKASGET